MTILTGVGYCGFDLHASLIINHVETSFCDCWPFWHSFLEKNQFSSSIMTAIFEEEERKLYKIQAVIGVLLQRILPI